MYLIFAQFEDDVSRCFCDFQYYFGGRVSCFWGFGIYLAWVSLSFWICGLLPVVNLETTLSRCVQILILPPLPFSFWHSNYTCYIFWYCPTVLRCSARLLFLLLLLFSFALDLRKFLLTYLQIWQFFPKLCPVYLWIHWRHSVFSLVYFWFLLFCFQSFLISIFLLPLSVWSCLLSTPSTGTFKILIIVILISCMIIPMSVSSKCIFDKGFVSSVFFFLAFWYVL